MRLPPALDRIWLWMIGISAVIGFPVLAILWAERVGWPMLLLYVAIVLGAGFYNGLSRR